MKNQYKILKCLSSFALFVTCLNINTACFVFMHQPKLPDAAKKLRKF